MNQSIVLRAALAVGAAAGVVAISACSPTSSGAPTPSQPTTSTTTQAPSTQPVIPSPPQPTASSRTSTNAPTPNAPTPNAPTPNAPTPVAPVAPKVVAAVPPAPIYYPNCGQLKYTAQVTKPANMMLSCDSELELRGAHWTTWNSSYAQATGVLYEDDCTPDCAEGTVYPNKATIRFDKPVKFPCGEFWSEVVISYIGNPVGVETHGEKQSSFTLPTADGTPSYC